MQEADFKWFVDNYDELYKKYGVAYIVIKNCQVLGAYSDFAKSIRETLKTEVAGTFIVQYCNGDTSAYTNYISSTNFLV